MQVAHDVADDQSIVVDMPPPVVDRGGSIDGAQEHETFARGLQSSRARGTYYAVRWPHRHVVRADESGVRMVREDDAAFIADLRRSVNVRVPRGRGHETVTLRSDERKALLYDLGYLLPCVERVSAWPLLGPEGVTLTGESPDGGTLVVSPLTVPHVDIATARWTIACLLSGFTFRTPRDLAVVLAALVTPILGLDDPKPFLAMLADDATEETGQGGAGVGKSTLAKVISRIYAGRILAEKNNALKFQYAYDGVLARDPGVVVLDNLAPSTLDANDTFKSIVTAYGDELISVEPAKMAQTEVWPPSLQIATMTSACFGPEIERRAVRAYLCPRPRVHDTKADGADPQSVVRRYRALILGSLAALVQHWHEAGRPDPVHVKRTFEPWAKAAGGVVTCCWPDLMPYFAPDRAAESQHALAPAVIRLLRHWPYRPETSKWDDLTASELCNLLDETGTRELCPTGASRGRGVATLRETFVGLPETRTRIGKVSFVAVNGRPVRFRVVTT